MSRLVILVFIAILTFLVILFIQQPEYLEQIWIWVLGLIGTILDAGRRLIDFFQNRLSRGDKAAQAVTTDGRIVAVTQDNRIVSVTPVTAGPDGTVTLPAETPSTPAAPPQIPSHVQDSPADLPFDGMTLTVLRYSDDGETTLGLLYLNGKFYCYTLEDTFRPVKIKGQTRIPQGTYRLAFNVADTGLTLKYRDRYPWFTFHLHLKDVPNYTGVYIHNGGRHEDSEGCILVSDRLTQSDNETVFTNSQNTYKRLYEFLSEEIDKGTRLRIIVRDEAWFKQHYT